MARGTPGKDVRGDPLRRACGPSYLDWRGGRIDALVFPKNVIELAEAVTFLRARRIPFLPVGNWTNLIVTSGGYRGVSFRSQ